MQLLCIKTNNENNINYILENLEKLNNTNIHYKIKEFKKFNNIFIYYTGDDIDDFYSKIATILSYLIIDLYEFSFLDKILKHNYFYFDLYEKKEILESCLNIILNKNDFSIDDKFIILFNYFYNYIYDNRKLYLSGFITFRIKEYFLFLENIVDIAVNKYIVEREYLEFISLLKYYINSNTSSTKLVHLIYEKNNSILLDDKYNKIDISKIKLNTTYLSDISFSENDYLLNALLTLLPKKIIIHLNSSSDEFIDTLKLIFEKRVSLEIKAFV